MNNKSSDSTFGPKFILDENNWSSYKYHAETYAYKIEADDIIDGTEAEPAKIKSSADPKEVAQYENDLKTFQDKCRKMYYYIRVTQSEATRIHLVNIPKNDARGAWKALCDYYESSSMASIKQLLTKLVRLKQTTSVPMFLDELGRLKGQIKTAVAEKKQDVMDVLSQMVLLDGLKPEFDAVKQILFLDDSLTFELCKQRVLETAERLKIEQDETGAALSYSQALRSQASDHVKTAAVAAHPESCPHCNKRWHPAEKCWTLHPDLKAKHFGRANRASGGATDPLDEGLGKPNAWRVQSDLPSSQVHIAQSPPLMSNIISFDLDSACSDHFVNSFTGVSNFNPSSHIEVELANGSKVTTAGQGSIKDRLPVIHYAPTFASPLLSVARLVDDNKAVLFHPRKGVLLLDASKNDAVLAVGYRTGNSFKLDVRFTPPAPSAAAVTSVTPSTSSTSSPSGPGSPSPEWKLLKSHLTKSQIVLLHNRSDHPAATRMFHAYHHKTTDGMCLPVGLVLKDFQDAIGDCEACRLAKSKAQPHRPHHGPRPKLAPFAAIAVDIKGPIEIVAIGGERYVLMIVCLATDLHFSFPLKFKSDELDVLKRFEGQVVRSQGYRIHSIRWDNSKEQRSREVDAWLTASGIRSEPTAAYSSAMNGAAERAIQTDAAVARTLRIAAHLPKPLYAELFRTASFLHQYTPSRLNDDDAAAGMTPYERFHGKKPDVSFLRTIGCVAYVHVHKPCRKALDPTAVKGRLIGYTMFPRGYRVLLDDNRIVGSPHVTFSEAGSTSAPGWYTAQGPVDPDFSDWRPVIAATAPPRTSALPRASLPAAPTSPLPPPTPSRASNPYSVLSSDDDDGDADAEDVLVDGSPAPLSDLLSESPAVPDNELRLEQYLLPELSVLAPSLPTRTGAPSCSLSRLPPPSHARRVCAVKKITYRDALQDDRLRKSMLAEIHALFTGADPPAEIVDLPPGRRPIGCTWAHKLKYKATGEFDRAKSRVCPLGYQQVPGIDFDPSKVTSPVISLGGSFLFLNIAAQRRMKRTLLDVDGAFALITLQEEVYMRFPPGMKAPPGKAIRLRHSLNGLKQSGFNWHEKAHAHMLQQGFRHSQIEPCLYWKWVDDSLQMVALYVDDFHIAADNPDHLLPIIEGFKSVFPCKTQNGSMYLGMIITDCENGDIEIGQEACIDGLLSLLNLTDCCPVGTPAVPNRRLVKATTQDETVKSFPYRAAVGSLLWLARCSRPDIFFAVTQLAAHASCFNLEHVQAVKHCARYLKGTRHLRLRLRHGAPGTLLRAYADADFAGEPQENDQPMHSLSGSVLYIAGTGPIFWQSKLQPTLSRSTAEAEYRSSGLAAQHVAAYRTILQELGFAQPDPTLIYEDNQACIAMTNSLLCSSKARHIKLDHHYIRQQVREGEIALTYCDTTSMIADIFTKALPKIQFVKLRNLLMTAL